MSGNRIDAGETVTFTVTFEQDGIAYNPVAPTFEYVVGRFSDWTDVTPVQESTGTYSATFEVPEDAAGRLLNGRWQSNDEIGVVRLVKLAIDKGR